MFQRCLGVGLQGLLAFILLAGHLNEYPGAFTVGRQQDFIDRTKAYAGIAQFSFDDGPNLFLQGLAHASQVILFATLLRHF